MKNYLGNLLHLCDPTLPIGGYTHSNGLETYVQLKLVHDEQTTQEFVHNMISHNLLYNDAAFVRLAYEATQRGEIEELVALDHECTALKAPVEIQQASIKLGIRVAKIFERDLKKPEFLKAYQKAIEEKQANGHYALMFGLFAAQFNIPLYETLYAFCYNAAVGMVTNAVKLIPLSQMKGQDVLLRTHDVIAQTVEKILTLDRGLVGTCNIAFDIRSMQHERLYSRLYMS